MGRQQDAPLGAWPVVVTVVAVLALVGLIAFARGAPGDDGRAPDPESATLGAPAEAGAGD